MTKEVEKKMTAGERRAQKRKEQIEKGQRLSGTFKGSDEPIVTQEKYNSQLLHALNYYNSAYDTKDKRKWTLAYVGKAKAKQLEELPDFDFHSIGTVIRLKERQQYLAEKEESFIEKRLNELFEKAKNFKAKSSSIKPAAEEKPAKPVVSIQDRIALKASEVAGEFDGMIDDFITAAKDPDFASYLKANEISPQVAKLIPAFYVNTIAELKEAMLGKDPQLVEGYSNFSKVQLRRLIKHYESIEDVCAQQAVSAKAAKVRKPRAKKEKPASVVAKNVKYLKEFAELGLTSEKPEKLVGCSEVWIYNTKYKRIQVYRSVGGDGKMTVKGSSIIGYEVASSGQKTMRKPEEVKNFVSMTKRTFDTAFKALKTKESAVNGRINAECVILKVFG